ncbi:LCP family protein [Microbacterium sp. 13-71-7]|jgi:LCP family protein required for cell wall assembly|uniref:LCP family protein n=1 Tax=Microbacterium sp. 13-71-7 TaxID=1970399 RepID=UPI000BCFFBB8|nr:LCP family protein [Microbacterium sp. 13-71-7]OZB85029.1 MAG: transcriptional regulator [Microbacterium sp. 13-71-7]
MTRSRRPVAGHGQLRRPTAWSQLMKMLGIAMAVVLVSGVSVAAYVAYDLGHTFSANAVALDGEKSVPPDIGAIKGGVNMLLVGSDACEPEFSAEFGDRCSDPENAGERNDTNLLLHISDSPRRVTVITFPRDLMVPIPSCTDAQGNATSEMSKQPINVTLETGGLNCVARTIHEVSGLDIQFAAKVTWGGVMKITDAIGGVDVCVANGMSDPDTGLELTAGTHTLQGYWALQFLRTRHGVGDGSDLGRGSNQQVYMSSLARKVVSSEVLGNPGTLLKLANTVMSNVTPSTTLTSPTLLVQIALAMKDVPLDQINFVNYPVLTDPDNPNKVVPDTDSADQLWAALAANQAIQVAGQRDDAVVSATPAPTDPATTDPATTDPSAAPTPGATSGPVQLPKNVSGQSAAQQTCSNGNGYRG